MRNELLTKRLHYEDDLEELSEVDARTVARARAEEKLSIVTKLILTNAVPLEIIAKVSGLPIEELKKIKKDLTPSA